jgi:hypothetical protein
MTFPSEYDVSVKRPVQRPISASALLGIFAIPLLLVSFSFAQHESTSSAASSSSGHSFSGGAPGPVSTGHTGYTPPNSGTVTFSTSHSQSSNGPSGDHHHHPHSGASSDVYYPYLYPVLIPYTTDAASPDSDNPDDDDAEYQGGPTVFDRRGSGAASYIAPTYEGPAHAHTIEDASMETANSDSEPPQPPTTLVFKDGHQLEIDNYAIVSQTLFDLTPGHPRKIALADLDLAATEKQNDDRGIVFQLPHPPQAN